MFRISRNGQEPIVNLDTVEQIEPEIRALPPGNQKDTHCNPDVNTPDAISEPDPLGMGAPRTQ
jgi:hypothetical protein